mmetsp:Transcript_18592/g.22276  ORF Transcript_18592/g.22276 Transcript_18592/m.22276 type:complete len:129 (-) Transcript_18592:305-691(-)|eukprot:CAMPEP_0197860440 /NCGR_PEP_ID=MMETSP1438-20131217/35809_1 /TAXON_ID=1461541 /ORGANISM="Pterosperma sp., Strain CCMP1384" /LENGTH=128 /DNA_ID=CAMNT_0043477297 /DNA_START=1 /DNA_END=387 /DNA_ORIENTATION=+
MLRKEYTPTFSVLRLDGDMYISTMIALCALYDSLSVGGYIIIDDYGVWPMCRKAVLEFREIFDITDTLRCIEKGANCNKDSDMTRCNEKYRHSNQRQKIRGNCNVGATFWQKTSRSDVYGKRICAGYM